MIKVKNLSKHYGDFKAVDDISFEVGKGEIFAFLGPNGAGKTTSIKMLTTLIRPTGGEIVLNGFDPLREQDAARRSFGIVFQDQSIDDELTAYENMYFHAVLYGIERQRAKQKIDELLRYFELDERRDSLVREFSGGMKRRLEIARGLVHEPEILFLDEPTLGLDPQTRNRLWDRVSELNKNKGMTVFLTTHYIEEAERVSDKVAIIDHGRIMAMGLIAEVKASVGAMTLEEAFLKITGRDIRPEESDGLDRMRRFQRIRK